MAIRKGLIPVVVICGRGRYSGRLDRDYEKVRVTSTFSEMLDATEIFIEGEQERLRRLTTRV